LKDGVSESAKEYAPLIENNDTLISQMKTELKSIEKLRDAAHDLSLKYKEVYKQAIAAVDAIHKFIKAQEEQAAAAAKREADEAARKKKQQQKKDTGKKGNKGQWESDNYSGLLQTNRA